MKFLSNFLMYIKNIFSNLLKDSGVKNELLSVLFVASFVFLIHHNTSLFAPFDYIALHINTVFSSQVNTDKKDRSELIYRGSFIAKELEKHPNEKNSPVLLIYDQNIYDQNFSGISPLDRCILAKDLSSILEENPKIVAIDLDLSPLEHSKGQYEECQKKLNKVLMKYSNKIVLIDPIRISEKVEEWIGNMKKGNITFANPIITSSLGIVLNRSYYGNSLGQTVYEKLHSKHSLHKKKEHKISHVMPINYTEAGRFKIIKEDKTLKDRVVFVGGAYGTDDTYLTPLDGNMPGVMIHAYDYFSAEHPVKTSGIVNLLAYILDVIFALIIGYVMKKLWGFYIKLLKQQIKSSYIILISIFLVLTIFVIIGMIMASYLLRFNIWVSPIPIIIAIFFDGIINSLIEQYKDEKVDESDKKVNTNYLDDIAYFIKVATMLFVIAYSIYYILSSMFMH